MKINNKEDYLKYKNKLTINNLLYYSSLYDYFDEVKYALNNGAFVAYGDNIALRMSCYYGHLDIVKYLIEQGADIHAWDDEALRYSVNKNRLDIVKYLINNNANYYRLKEEEQNKIKHLLREIKIEKILK